MRKKSFLLTSCILFAAMLIMVGGCSPKPKVTPIPPEPKKEPVAPKPEPKPVIKPDTSSNVSYNEAELDAAFKRKVAENLQVIYFAYDSYKLSPTGLDQLGKAGKFLKEYPSVRVLVEGHCDERGSAQYNMGLGENRSRAVKEYLINYGIGTDRIEITSWGKEHLISLGCTDDDCHQKNRRTEFKVLSK